MPNKSFSAQAKGGHLAPRSGENHPFSEPPGRARHYRCAPQFGQRERASQRTDGAPTHIRRSRAGLVRGFFLAASCVRARVRQTKFPCGIHRHHEGAGITSFTTTALTVDNYCRKPWAAAWPSFDYERRPSGFALHQLLRLAGGPVSPEPLVTSVNGRAVVAVERRGRGRFVRGRVPRPVAGVDEEQILMAVVVVIEEGHAAAQGFRHSNLSP